MAMDLHKAKGTYVLIASVAQMKRLEIGRLDAQDIVPGCYVYVRSAFGSGGLRARIGHHLESTAIPHWHIDYLLRVAQSVEVWYTTANQELEHHWADVMEKAPNFRVPIPRFGSSDYHRSRRSDECPLTSTMAQARSGIQLRLEDTKQHRQAAEAKEGLNTDPIFGVEGSGG